MPKSKQSKSNSAKTKLSPTKQLVLAVCLFVGAVLLSRDVEMPEWEVSLFHVFYGLPAVLLWPLSVVTQLGSFYILLLLAGVYFFWKRYHIVLRLLMTGFLAYIAAGFAKDIWGRGRPFDLLPDVTHLEYIVRGPGFPSGHMALATALALTMGHYMPKKYHWLVVLWIVGVGLSRMYLGVHTPLDIVGGFAIGWAAYALFRHVRLYDTTYSRKNSRKKAK